MYQSRITHATCEVTEYDFGEVSRESSILYACKVVPREVLADSLMESFEREIQILPSLNYLNIVPLVDVVYTPDLIYVIMEFCSGGDLFTMIEAAGACDERRCRKIFRDLLLGLQYLHARSISHRDLKPENMLLAASNRLLKTPCGSKEYSPPEILRGLRYDGAKADIWSLGVVLYVLFAGALPWTSRHTAEVYVQAAAGDFLVPPAAPPAAAEVVRRMLDAAPWARPPPHPPRKRRSLSGRRWTARAGCGPAAARKSSSPPCPSGSGGWATVMCDKG
jgi:BR serine/threonine kinase